MQLNPFRMTRAHWFRKHKLLIWATLISMIAGVIQFGEPLDQAMRIARNKIRSHPPSGQIVIVGIDERSVQSVADWPWNGREYARMVERLNDLDAKRIFFTIEFPSYAGTADDKLFAQALAASKAEVTLPVRFVEDPTTGSRRDLAPSAALGRHAALANINALYHGLIGIWALPYSMNAGDRYYPSLASKLAGRDGDPQAIFPIDYSIDLSEMPVLNAADIIEGQVAREKVAGKDIVIGTTSRNFGQIYPMPGIAQAPAVFFHALGGETLLSGKPLRLGWLLPIVVALGVVLFSRRVRPAAISYLILGLGLVSTPIIPLVLESHLIFVDVVPAMILLVIVVTARIWMAFRQKGITTNPVSGLPNLNALRQESAKPGYALVAVRILNYAAITSALPEEMEKTLVEQIAQRLGVGARGAALFQGDEGIFAWMIERSVSLSIGDELEALHALFRSPVVVEGRHLDLSLAFGVDMGGARSLANRLGSALVAADEAGAEGLRWKAYDPARLEDAEWKLSLLGRLDAAIDDGEIWVAYQPKMDIASKQICGAEALARWSHPEKGDISPEDFILAAEQHNRIEKLTAHVLDQALATVAAFQSQGIEFGVSVNLSTRLLENPNLLPMIRALLSRHRVEAQRLTMEVTESAAMTSGRSIEMLKKLCEIGVDVSLDDYGTGFSTLDYLKKVPASEIKIDKSFVDAMDRSQSDRIMVSSTVSLAHSLKRRVVAEGVERVETLQALEYMGCDLAQGYLIGRPMPFKDLHSWYFSRQERMVA